MGSLFHIAEVAALLLVAYVVGWSVGFLLHLAVRPRATAETIPAERLAAAMGEGASADALVKAPTIVEVEKAPAPVKVAASALAPAPEAPKPADPVVATVVPVAPPAPPPGPKLSAIETLRSLSSAMPLLPGEPAPVLLPATAQLPALAAEPAPLPVYEPVATIATTSSAGEVAAAVAEITAAVVDASPAAPPPPAVPEPIAPPPEPEIAAAPPAPASVPGQAWAGKIHGHEAPPLPAAAELTAEPPQPLGATVPLAPEPHPQPLAAEVAVDVLQQEAADGKPLVVEEPVGLEASLLSIVEAHLPPEAKSAPNPAIENALLASVAGGLAIDDEAEAALTAPPQAEPVAAPSPASPEPAPEPLVEALAASEPEPAPLVPEPVGVTPPPEPPYVQAPVEFDESAAMRDIEGGWSRRRTRAMSDATDVGAAVNAAQVAVENVLARNGVTADRQAGKPKGLPGPRDGRRDNLKQINGLGQLDESTLNNLGVYHFEQVAAWSAAEVLWLENHAFARGRIGQEGWQQQASALADERAARRAAH